MHNPSHILVKKSNLFLFVDNSEICFVENQSNNDKQKTSLVSAIQEFTKDSKMLSFIYKLKQSSLWTEYFCDNDQTHTIKSHSDFFGWGEMFTLLFVYLGTRFFSIISLDKLLLQSVLGKNFRRHQLFDHDEDFKLSSDDPRPILDQGVQNVLAHWIPRFIVDSFHDLVLDGAKDTHTITYKDTGTVLAPTLVRHMEETYKLKAKQKDKHGQTLMSESKYMVENEAPNDEGKSHAYLSIPQPDHKKEHWEKFEHHFKLALHGSQYLIRERMSRASKYPDQNLAKKYAQTFNH